MTNVLRTYAISKFSDFLGVGASARNSEISLLKDTVSRTRNMGQDPSWDNPFFRRSYKNKLLNLIEEMKRDLQVCSELTVQDGRVTVRLSLVPQLVLRLKRKELLSKDLALYTPEVLAPQGLYSHSIRRYKARELMLEQMKVIEDNYEGILKCGKCKSLKTTYYQLQTRSADEGLTNFCQCIACGHRWRFN